MTSVSRDWGRIAPCSFCIERVSNGISSCEEKPERQTKHRIDCMGYAVVVLPDPQDLWMVIGPRAAGIERPAYGDSRPSCLFQPPRKVKPY